MCWPPRSPDLTVTATLKVRVFHTLPATREELKRKVREEIAAISQQDKESAMSSLLSRLNKCIAFEEVTRETLLQ